MTLAGEVAVRVTERVDVALGLGFSRSVKRSHYNDWFEGDEGEIPIEQSTELSRVPITVSAKVYLKDRGRSVSQLAWIPERWAPYVGFGGGVMSYDFEQRGDFVEARANDPDFADIFSDILLSGGKTATGHVMGGADFSLSPRLLLTAEGRYTWASAPMSPDFVNYDDMDLSGLQATLGFAVRF